MGSWSVAGAQPLSLRYLAAGAACIAANFGCRPTFALSALLCFPIFWPQITSLLQGLKSRSLPPRRALRAPAAVIIPALIVVLPLMAYNVARFGSPLDFGNDYQMTVTDMTRFVQPTANFLPSVGAYLFLPLRFTSEFPFIGMTPMAFREWGYYELMAGGLFTACPLLLLALAAPFLRRRMHRSGYWGLATCSLALAVLLAVFDSHTAGPGMALHLRFRVDDGDRRAGADAVSHASRWRRDRGWCARSVGNATSLGETSRSVTRWCSHASADWLRRY